MSNETNPQTKHPFIATTELAIRIKEAEAVDVNELLSSLQTPENPIGTMKATFWAIFDKCKQGMAGNIQPIQGRDQADIDRIAELEAELEKYNSIDITRFFWFFAFV